MIKSAVIVLIAATLTACQSGGGGSMNTSYAGPGNCYYSYDYSNTGTSSCLGRMWH